MKSISKNAEIAQTAVIYDDVVIEDNVIIHDFVVIYPNTVIKSGTEVFDHCVLGKMPTSPGVTSRELKSHYDQLIIGENCVLCPGVVLYTGSTFGHNNLFGDNCSVREECLIGDYNILSRNVTVNYHTKIGSYTKIMDSTHITGDMEIGDHVFISLLVATSNDNTIGRENYSPDHVKGPTIEDYVTVGAGANILPGVRVGRDSIVGAGAVVTKDVPERKVVMGIPARIVRDVED